MQHPTITSLPHGLHGASVILPSGEIDIVTDTILVIEDDAMQADVVKLLLSQAGYDVVVARDGVEGLRRMYETQPDLVLLDLVMPNMDGWEVCRRIRDMANVPIIIMTSRRSDEEKIKGIAAWRR